MRAVRLVLASLLLASLGVASWVALPVQAVEVVGHRHLSPSYVQEVTGLKPGSPWLWAWPHRLKPLLQNPWVREARLERPAWGQLRIVLEERTPIASLVQNSRRYGLSADGVLLPGAPPRTPQIRGLGEAPLAELVRLVELFPKAQEIRYGVGGYQVRLEGLWVWGQSVRELQGWAELRRIGPSASGNPLGAERVYVYSWGVSARR
ncbi:cell division protein FtsQ [Meiothermus sp. QL-1]|uniref:cell division protein FtsQ/DivIB n=1 Tax=Meiothermus sp. QL-1 TaxID=2058095 RepID=UPI000E0AE7C7|nr:FtsQ-type POTRA domain-containing protein [Meiothermus sp. QL-1]RDI96537.1 cell division protein FtsQ [Meiothermus sp. QL-1]